MHEDRPDILRVAAGVLVEDGRVLIARRHAERLEGLKWEFPDGKLEPEETAEECLARELSALERVRSIRAILPSSAETRVES